MVTRQVAVGSQEVGRSLWRGQLLSLSFLATPGGLGLSFLTCAGRVTATSPAGSALQMSCKRPKVRVWWVPDSAA